MVRPSSTEIAAAIATLRQLPVFNTEKSISPPPGFEKDADSGSPDTLHENKVRLSVFSRIMSNWIVCENLQFYFTASEEISNYPTTFFLILLH